MSEPLDVLQFYSSLRSDLTAIVGESNRLAASANPADSSSVGAAITSLTAFMENRIDTTPNSRLFASLRTHPEKRQSYIDGLVRNLLLNIWRKAQQNYPHGA